MKLTEAIKKSGVSAIVYGESGIGKTHFAGTLPGKTLVIAAEANGIKTLARSENLENIDLNDEEQVQNLFQQFVSWLKGSNI